MQPKEIVSLVRKAIDLINASPTIEANIDQQREDFAVVSDFIAFCKALPENSEVPTTISTAWEAIPDEWLEGNFPEQTSENGYNACQSFGKFSARSKACKHCQTQDVDEFIRCQKATEINKKPTREPAGTSRYGHVLGSKSAFVDDYLPEGASEETILAGLMNQWPDMSRETAINKIRSHISWLPRVRGVEITIIREDDGYHYKASVDHWCGSKEAVVPVTNVKIDNRTAVVEKAEKKAEKKARAEGEKKLKEEKNKVEKIKGGKKKGEKKVAKPSAIEKPSASQSTTEAEPEPAE